MNQPIVEPSSSQVGAAEKTKMPLSGIIVLLASALGLAGWMAVRVQEAEKAKAVVALTRAEDNKKQLAALQAVRQVEVTRGVVGSWVPIVDIDGTLVAGQTAELGFKAGGRLQSVSVKIGDEVKLGQLLATLDSSEAVAQLAAARAQVRASEAGLALAEDSEKRTAPLVESGAIAEATGVQTSQQRALSVAQLEAANAQLALAQVALGNHRLTAPFAGTVTRAPDGLGTVVGPGSPLFQISSLGNLKLQGTVSVEDAALVRAGSPIALTVEGGQATGTITIVLGTVDQSTRRVRVEASVPNPGGLLRAGTFVRAQATAEEGIPILKVPHGVLRPGTQNEVLVVTGAVLSSRRIAFSFASNGELLVRHGLGPDDQVVLDPKPEDVSGLVVEIAQAAEAKPPGTKP
jgi:RND family efflux transporter MFP subunit